MRWPLQGEMDPECVSITSNERALISLLRPRKWLRSIVMNMSACGCVCLSVCLSARMSPEPHARSLPNFLCMLPVSVVRSSSDKFTIGRIACRREGLFFQIGNALSAGKVGWECTARPKYAIYDCLVRSAVWQPEN